MDKNIDGPLFIAFIGIDGMGKSTQIHKFAAWMRAITTSNVSVGKMDGYGNQVIQELARVMYGDPHRYHPGIDPDIRAIACSVDTTAYYLNVVKPELDAGSIFVSDRYVHCQYAYFRAYGTTMYWPTKLMSLAKLPRHYFST